jgi:hypothetical protein
MNDTIDTIERRLALLVEFLTNLVLHVVDMLARIGTATRDVDGRRGPAVMGRHAVGSVQQQFPRPPDWSPYPPALRAAIRARVVAELCGAGAAS